MRRTAFRVPRLGLFAWGFLLLVCRGESVTDALPPVADWATLLLLQADSLPLTDSGPGFCRVEESGSRLVPGRFGGALDAAVGGHLFHLAVDAQPTDCFTLECWVLLRERGDERLQRIVGRNGNFGLYVGGRSPTVTFFVSAREWCGLNAALPLGRWVHLAGTFDGREMALFVDGERAGERPCPGAVPRGPQPFFLGAEAGSEEHRFLGGIDAIRLSKVVRTDFFSGTPLPEVVPTTAWTEARIDAEAFLRTVPVFPLEQAPAIDGDADAEVWEEIAAIEFLDTRTAERPATATTVRAGADAEALYLFFHCHEKGQESFRPTQPGRDDAGIFRGDAVEVFLQPGGADTPYVQLVFSPSGGLFDCRWEKPGAMVKADLEGVRSAGRTHPDTWTVEASIPFAALGVASPAPGSTWRGNLCRNEQPTRELSAAAPTGGGFHVPERFAVLRFGRTAVPGTTQGGLCELRGTVRDDAGKGLGGVPVRTAVGLARTDAFGDFRLGGIPVGENVVVDIRSPRYLPFTAAVRLTRPLEIAPAVVLQPVDPYLPAAGAPSPAPVTWLASSLEEPPDMSLPPGSLPRIDALGLLATPGEYESRAAAFLAGQTLARPQLRLGPLTDREGRVLGGCRTQLRWTQRLLKRVQYTRPREDAVWNWRFLWPEAPDEVRAGHLRQIVVTVHVPEDAAAGVYRGTLDLLAGGEVRGRLPVELTVAGFRLREPRQRVGCYYGIRGTPPEQIRVELADIREHGGRVLVWHEGVWYNRRDDDSIEVLLGPVREAVLLQRNAGIGPPFLVGTNPLRAADLAGLQRRMTPEYAAEIRSSETFRAIYAQGLRALAQLEKELGVGEFLYTWMDEVFGEGRFEPWQAFSQATRDLSGNRIYITFHNRVQEMVDRAAPHVDVRCYHGHTLDWWLGEGHSWNELRRELEADGDEAWSYYNIREIAVTSEWVRLCNGYWLWKSPLLAHVPWKYYSFGESPFDDLDSDRHDFAYAAPHPDRPEMVSTLEWECFREGYDDLRYLATLEGLAGEARARGRALPLADEAETLLEAWRTEDPRVPRMAETFTAPEYARRREAMARLAEALTRALGRGQ
ncbi:MAG: hypothetical protein JXR77_16215 [Lentisphaeria bacterium]|nr:hypothetical protein [Lentisphaeria bacterium]